MDVPPPAIFPIIGRLFKSFSPVGAAAIVRGSLRKRRQEIRIQDRGPGDALPPSRNNVYRTGSGRRRRKRAARICRIGILKSAYQKAASSIGAAEGGIQGGVGEVSGALQGRGDMSATHTFLDQPVPFLRSKEKDFVLLDRTPDGASEVVPANGIFLGVGVSSFKNGVLGIQKVVAAEVIGAAVEGIRPRLGDERDHASAGSAELCAIAVALDLELLDGVKGGVN